MDKLYKGDISHLRNPQRLKIVEVERVVELSLEKIFVTKVLDIGCGTGLFAESFFLRNLEVTAIDINQSMIENAKKHIPFVNFMSIPAEKLPFEDKSFDLVFIGLMLHESNDPAAVLREALRVASIRVAILEWKYEDESIGPPLSQRIKPDFIKKMAREKNREVVVTSKNLTYLILYLIDFHSWK